MHLAAAAPSRTTAGRRRAAAATAPNTLSYINIGNTIDTYPNPAAAAARAVDAAAAETRRAIYDRDIGN